MAEETDSFKGTKEKLKQHLRQRILLLRLQGTQHASKIASIFITIVVIAVVIMFLLIFISITAGCWLAYLTGSLVVGFAIVTLFYLVVLIFIIFFFRKMLQNFFINKIIQLIYKKD